MQFEKKLTKPVTLATLRAHAAKLKGMLLLAPGSRLSVTPVRPEHWDYVLDLAGELQPARAVARGFRIVVIGCGVELRRVRVGSGDDAHGPDDARLGTAGVVEEGLVAGLHLVAEHVAHLVVAHAIPAGRLLRPPGQIVDRETVGLGFHQPVRHTRPRSVTVPSTGRSQGSRGTAGMSCCASAQPRHGGCAMQRRASRRS